MWSLAWHPQGHCLATGGADHCSRFWSRARPGDAWRDKARGDQEIGGNTVGQEASHLALKLCEAIARDCNRENARRRGSLQKSLLCVIWEGLAKDESGTSRMGQVLMDVSLTQQNQG